MGDGITRAPNRFEIVIRGDNKGLTSALWLRFN